MVVAEKPGRLTWHRLSDGKSGTLLEITRIGASYVEKGLVGFTFHPDFPATSKIYTYQPEYVLVSLILLLIVFAFRKDKSRRNNMPHSIHHYQTKS